MSAILCFGDSLTWGSDPDAGGARHALTDRWPTVLAEGLGPGHEVIAEGLGGRTTAYDDHLADCDRNGGRLLPTILHTHRPLDLVILMLGTNDLKPHICGSAAGAVMGIRRLIEIVRHHASRLPEAPPTPRVLVVAPPLATLSDDPLMAETMAGAARQSRKFAALYAAEAARTGCAFFDAATVAEASRIDGVHLDAANTRAIGRALIPVVKEALAP